MVGVVSMGIRCPIIREGDDLIRVILNSIYRTVELEDGDIIGITESVVARAEGNYVTVDEIADETKRLFGQKATITLVNPIYSRNRFSVILRGIARAASKLLIVAPPYDEVGNPVGLNPMTGVDICQYYKDICTEEECEVEFINDISFSTPKNVLLCNLHEDSNYSSKFKSLKDYFPAKCKWGLLGSNKATDEKVKLFPSYKNAQLIVNLIQKIVEDRSGKKVEVMIYGDGCFKDPESHIWEFADPVTSPAYTKGLEGSPNEIKLKAFADDRYAHLQGKELEEAIVSEIKNKPNKLVGNMASQGTTPRKYIHLLASLMDLTSGSGDKGTPVVVIKNYFNNYADA